MTKHCSNGKSFITAPAANLSHAQGTWKYRPCRDYDTCDECYNYHLQELETQFHLKYSQARKYNNMAYSNFKLVKVTVPYPSIEFDRPLHFYRKLKRRLIYDGFPTNQFLYIVGDNTDLEQYDLYIILNTAHSDVHQLQDIIGIFSENRGIAGVETSYEDFTPDNYHNKIKFLLSMAARKSFTRYTYAGVLYKPTLFTDQPIVVASEHSISDILQLFDTGEDRPPSEVARPPISVPYTGRHSRFPRGYCQIDGCGKLYSIELDREKYENIVDHNNDRISLLDSGDGDIGPFVPPITVLN